MPLVVQMHGEPGSGKTAVAGALARRIDAVALDKDVIKAALLDAGIAQEQAAAGAYDAYFALASALVAQGRSVILDNPVFWPRVEEQWLRLAAEARSPAVLIECVCADRDELRRRLSTRPALASQPREPLDLARHPGAAATAFQPRLVLDATRPLAELIDASASYIARLADRAMAARGVR